MLCQPQSYFYRLEGIGIFRTILPKCTFLVGKYIFTIFAYELFKVKMKNCKQYQKYKYLGQNTSKYGSQIIVVLVHANGFLYS